MNHCANEVGAASSFSFLFVLVVDREALAQQIQHFDNMLQVINKTNFSGNVSSTWSKLMQAFFYLCIYLSHLYRLTMTLGDVIASFEIAMHHRT